MKLDSQKFEKNDVNVISYESSRLIKIFDVDMNTPVAYVIKTLLEIINRWKSIEIHVLMKEMKEEKRK
jgi:hypothetical protein